MNKVVSKRLKNQNVHNQEKIDHILIKLDGTKQKTKIGEALYPLLVRNELKTENSTVTRALKRIEVLLEQLSEIESEIEDLVKREN